MSFDKRWKWEWLGVSTKQCRAVPKIVGLGTTYTLTGTDFDGNEVTEVVNLTLKCRTCGCLWRDNLDGSVSLFDTAQRSCQDCEWGSTEKACNEVPAALPALGDICKKCGHVVKERQLFTGSYVGCMC